MVIAGTGHRPDKLGGYGEPVLFKLQDIAIDYLMHNEVSKVISGMALGWDTALAMAAASLNIPFIAAVPFKGQETKWPTQSQVRYHGLLKMAESIVYVCDPSYAAWKMQIRNQYMVDKCDAVLAMWNGSSGGTANCIQYATKQNKTIINLYDKFI